MSLKTFSSFYYGHTVDSNNFTLDFDEGGPELQASLEIGDYTLTELLVEVKAQMDAIGGQTYSVSVDRSTRLVTISAPGNFSLLPVTGSRSGLSVFELLGFTADKTGSNSYVGDQPSGSEYLPQFILQDHISFDNWKESIDPVVNEATSGQVETVKFGTKQFMEANIKWITEYVMPNFGPIENDQQALTNIRLFLDFATNKRRFEYMEDRQNPGNFDKVILESTPESSTGTNYKLKEEREAAGFFSTGVLKFRKVN